LISRAAHSFASAIASGKIPEFDVLLGPAYKGISLAAVTTMTLYDKHGLDKAYCYNRKEKKDVGGLWREDRRVGGRMRLILGYGSFSMEKAETLSEHP
jgi:orotate phosphoribosyltransferase